MTCIPSGVRRAVCFGASVTWAELCVAQVSKERSKLRRVGILWTGSAPGAAPLQLERLLRNVPNAGFDVAIEVRFGLGEELRQHAASLVANKVDLIVAIGTPAALFAQGATASIPIVYSIAGDPIDMGLARSLAHPGGNSTGSYTMTSEISGKRVSLLREAVPLAKRVGLLWASHPRMEAEFNTARAAVTAMGAEAVSMAAADKAELLRYFAEPRSLDVDAISILTAPVMLENLKEIADLALRHRIPTIAGYSNFADLGGAMSYAGDPLEVWPIVVAQVEKVLKGARPMDLPVQRPQAFVLTLNLKTAAQLGLSMPKSLMLQAQRVLR
jgi:putative tryptophan/tyrosine transport system substrate-binding protein